MLTNFALERGWDCWVERGTSGGLVSATFTPIPFTIHPVPIPVNHPIPDSSSIPKTCPTINPPVPIPFPAALSSPIPNPDLTPIRTLTPVTAPILTLTSALAPIPNLTLVPSPIPTLTPAPAPTPDSVLIQPSPSTTSAASFSSYPISGPIPIPILIHVSEAPASAVYVRIM